MSVEQQVLSVAIDEIKGLIQPSREERDAAYALLVELATRTSSFKVSSAEGTIADSLHAVEEMFGLTRTILREHGVDAVRGSAGNLSLAVIAVRVLNEVFAPVLHRWAPRLDDHEARRLHAVPELTAVEWERLWPVGPQCRTELDGMIVSVRAYLDTLSRIAGAPEVADAVLHPPSSQIFERRAVPDAHPGRTASGAPHPRRKMVRWLSLVELVRQARLHVGHHAARPVPDGPIEPVAAFDAVRGEDFWFDYVADIGDAFDGTAPVAYLAGRHRISIPDDRSGEYPSPPAFLPRPRLLVFGGDQVYPYASERGYRDQAELPYQMGVEDPGDGEQATLVTIPGNHDWLGGIEHFEEMFASGRVFAGRWDTPQRRPYWHVRLPQGWWLWGIDTGLHNDWPSEQVEYFEAASAELRPGDRVVLCTPVPLWQLRQKYPDAYVRLRSSLDPLISTHGASMPLCLSGDSHFFAHYERIESEQREDHITAGGGGAFLQPTHNLAERIPHERGNAEFKLSSRWPLPTDSRALASGVGRVRDTSTWMLVGLLALVHLAYAGLLSLDVWHWTWTFDRDGVGEQTDPPIGVGWSAPFSVALLVLLVVGASFGALRPNHLERKLGRGARVYGALVGLALAASLVVVAAGRGWLLDGDDPPAWRSWVGWPASLVVGGFLSMAVLLGTVKWANGRVRAGDTFAFSSAHLTRYKHFLRCRIDRAGDLTVYVVGVDPVGEGWYEAMTEQLSVPPFDRAGIPRIHYVWGRTYRKFVPVPMEIAISASDPDEAGPAFSDALLAMCSKLIDGGHTLMYGGLPPSFDGITRHLRRIEVARHADNPNVEHHLINYIAEPYWDDTEGHRDDLLRSIRVTRVTEAGEDPTVALVRDLTAMRRRMTADADVRVIAGGALTPGAPGQRLAPGVVEEAYLALRAGLPLLVVGGFGGAAGLVADALFGRLDPVEVDRLERHFADPGRVASNGEAVAGFREMLCAFSSFGQLRNGLLDGENRELLTTRDPDTITALVWRSMHRLGRLRTR